MLANTQVHLKWVFQNLKVLLHSAFLILYPSSKSQPLFPKLSAEQLLPTAASEVMIFCSKKVISIYK